jgi:hypothetical protein
MPLSGSCVNAGTLILNYGATNVAPIQKGQPLLSTKRRPHFQTHNVLGTNIYLVVSPTGPENQEYCAGNLLLYYGRLVGHAVA